MKTVVDILIIIFILLGTYVGFKKGLIKTLVNFIGLVAIIIISYSLRYYLAEFLIEKLPFFNYVGFEGLTSINILIYNVISFIVIFILLYCVLNIIIAVTGFIDTLLKFTVIWVIPSKIGGAILGFLESWAFVFIVLFVLGSFNLTANLIGDSKTSNFILDHTPILGNYLYGATNAARDIYNEVKDYDKENKTEVREMNLYILQTEISYGLITREKAQELVDTGKIEVGDVTFYG